MARKPSLLGYTPPGNGLGAFLGVPYDYPKKEAPFPDLLEPNYDPAQWQARPDGSEKGQGYLGVLHRPDGGVSTEISASFDDVAGGKDIPLMVPTLNRDEVNALLNTPSDDPQFYQKIPRSVFQKAVDYAMSRQREGLPYFAQPYEYVNPPGSNKPKKK